MFDNHSFTVFNLLHNCSLSHYQYFKTVTAVTSQSKSLVHVVGKSYLLGCKLEIKTFKTSHSGRFEVAKIQSLQEAVCVDPMRGLHFSQISRNKLWTTKFAYNEHWLYTKNCFRFKIPPCAYLKN